MTQLQRPCPVCAHCEGAVLHRQSFLAPSELEAPASIDIVVCDRCGMAFSDLPVKQEVLDAAYRDHSKYADTSLYASGEQELSAQPPTDAPWDLQRLEETASWLSPQIPPGARILDAGCATGALIGFLQNKGFADLVGLDPSPIATAMVAHTYHVPTITGSFLTPSAELGDFDLVVLSHVLEHILDVEGAVRGLWELTRPGGLVYIEVPDAARYAAFLVAPFHDFNTEHINHFSASTLRVTMENVGFRVEQQMSKVVLSSPTDEYPAIFGLFRRPATPFDPPALVRDSECTTQLQRYVDASHRLMAVMSSCVRAAVGEGPVILWGAGQLSMKLLAGPLDGIEVAMVVDTSASKWGMHLGDHEIVGPAAAMGSSLPIVITSVHHEASIRETITSELGARKIVSLRPSPSSNA